MLVSSSVRRVDFVSLKGTCVMETMTAEICPMNRTVDTVSLKTYIIPHLELYLLKNKKI